MNVGHGHQIKDLPYHAIRRTVFFQEGRHIFINAIRAGSRSQKDIRVRMADDKIGSQIVAHSFCRLIVLHVEGL